MNSLKKFYKKLVITYKYATLICILSLIVFSISQLDKFRLDASSDTLVIEGDESLQYYESIKETYGSDDFVIITYSPKGGNLFTDASLTKLQKLHNELLSKDQIKDIISILNIPLLNSPRQRLKDINGGVVTIEQNNYSNLDEVKAELTKSPIFSNVLLSKDAQITSLLVWLQPTEIGNRVATESSQIKLIRDITSAYENDAEIFMGGIPMITSDSIAYIKNDIMIFGTVVIILIALLLFVAFREARWVAIPLLNSATICLLTIGFFACINWPVTVVSANFISLLLIISLSLSIHFTVRYQALSRQISDHDEVIVQAAKEKFKPCLYTAITTIVAFGSLILSNIKPVITFGYMMSVGIIIAFIVTFLFIPSSLSLLKIRNVMPTKANFHKHLAGFFCRLLQHHKTLLILIFLIISSLSIFGITKLSVENRFIDYYKEDTPIYQGMELIDQKLGGTTPLDVIIDAPTEFLDDEYSTGRDYWFNSFMLEDIENIHKYLESLPETGKVLSLTSTINTLKILNDNEVDSFFLAIVKKKMSQEIKEILLDPYLSQDGNQIRFSIRVYESNTSLKRQDLINKISKDITENYYINPENLHVTGMLVLYNDMLQSLFRSQILTLGAVLASILIMFTILFRNLKTAILALIPNIVTGGAVLGLMGLLSIPLDIMTITIAAITVGISVDDTIHYVHRYLAELKKTNNPWQAIINSHNTIGRAIYLTTITITMGFSILILSNFVPTMYFGLLTGFAMLIALLADLLLLPILLLFGTKKT